MRVGGRVRVSVCASIFRALAKTVTQCMGLDCGAASTVRMRTQMIVMLRGDCHERAIPSTPTHGAPAAGRSGVLTRAGRRGGDGGGGHVASCGDVER